jgi:hypothetical protein
MRTKADVADHSEFMGLHLRPLRSETGQLGESRGQETKKSPARLAGLFALWERSKKSLRHAAFSPAKPTRE